MNDTSSQPIEPLDLGWPSNVYILPCKDQLEETDDRVVAVFDVIDRDLVLTLATHYETVLVYLVPSSVDIKSINATCVRGVLRHTDPSCVCLSCVKKHE